MKPSPFLFALFMVGLLAQGALPEPFRQRLQAVIDRNLDLATLEKLDAAEPALADLYGAIKGENRWAARLKPMLGDDPLITRACAVLDGQARQILAFCRQRLEPGFLGEAEAFRAPDLIVILGASPAALEGRLQVALGLAERFPSVPIIASGGGRTLASEAEGMTRFLVDHGVPPGQLFREDLSLDTVGNAVFSKLLIQEHGLAHAKVLVVTSAFHGLRSLFLFRKVFGPASAVAVALARNPEGAAELERRLDDELTQLSATARNMFQLSPEAGTEFGAGSRFDGDERAILDQMLLDHDLYKYRWELARRFNGTGP